MECLKYEFHIFTVSDGMCSINLGGLQADLMGGSGGAEPPQENKSNTFSLGLLTEAEQKTAKCSCPEDGATVEDVEKEATVSLLIFGQVVHGLYRIEAEPFQLWQFGSVPTDF